MSVFDDDSFVILGDDASESVPQVSAQVDDSIDDDVFAAPSSDYGGYSNGDDGPILPPPSEMETDEGAALREWRRLDLKDSTQKKACYFARCSAHLVVRCDLGCILEI